MQRADGNAGKAHFGFLDGTPHAEGALGVVGGVLVDAGGAQAQNAHIRSTAIVCVEGMATSSEARDSKPWSWASANSISDLLHHSHGQPSALQAAPY